MIFMNFSGQATLRFERLKIVKYAQPLIPDRCFAFALIIFALYAFQGCDSPQRDRFELATNDLNLDSFSDLGQGFACGSGNLGEHTDGHGFQKQSLTFVITYKSAEGKSELVWPDFLYGNDQANAVVLDNILVFTARLPDGRPVLMAHQEGAPPLVISAPVLRLAAQRLGTAVIVPETDYSFDKVRLPPDRIWLQGVELSASNQKRFTVELNSDDLIKVMDETRRSGKRIKAKKYEYIAEDGAPSHIKASDVKKIESEAQQNNIRQTTPALLKGASYTWQRERLHGAVILDPANHHAYFSTIHQPGRILKVALGDGSKVLPTVVGAVVLEPEEDNTFFATIDPRGKYAYFGTHAGHVVKIDLGSSNEPPHRVGSVLLNAHYSVRAGVVDSATGYGCFSAGNRLYKLNLGKADEPPSIVSHFELPAVERDLVSTVFDSTTHHAYFGSEGGKIYKVALGIDGSPLRLVGELKLPVNESGLRGAIINPKRGCAWFTSNSGSLVKVTLGEKDNPPQRIGALKLNSRFRYLEHTFGMDDAGYAYFGTTSGGDADAAVLKIALGKEGELPRLVSSMPLPPDVAFIAEGIVNPISRILCLGVGSADCKLLKLSLQEGDAPPKILGATKLY